MNTSTLIVGAGPYGLSLANYLEQQGKEFFIVGKPMELWRNHTFDFMALRSDYATSVIHAPGKRFSFERFAAATQRPISDFFGRLPVKIYRQYLDWCQTQFRFPVENQYIVSLDRKRSSFRARLTDGSVVDASQVILATGIAHHLQIPSELHSANRVLHSYETQSIQKLRNQKVLVVGAGQSAAESIAVLLEQNNEVEWVARKQPVFYSEPLNLPKPIFNLILQLPAMLRYLPPELLRSGLSRFSATTITPDFKPYLESLRRRAGFP
ncbi:MAG: SidA/IucD/PvdA family monooxygenase, partial [FCB group bacterium]|nr:SidA/IucD/PvdA family monooxygenase [FCB group bacterium]